MPLLSLFTFVLGTTAILWLLGLFYRWRHEKDPKTIRLRRGGLGTALLGLMVIGEEFFRLTNLNVPFWPFLVVGMIGLALMLWSEPRMSTLPRMDPRKLWSRRSGGSSEGLIGVLLDPHAPDGDRDDEAGDLSKYDDQQVEAALITVASDPATDPDLADTYGDSLGEIWVRTGFVKPTLFLQLQPAAQRLVIAWLWATRPELIEQIEHDTGVNPVHEYWTWREAGYARPPDHLDALPAYLSAFISGATEGWTWPSIILLDTVMVGSVAGVLWRTYQHAHTRIDADGITQPSLRGMRRLAWADVRGLSRFGFGITVRGDDFRIVLSPYAYKAPDTVISGVADFINARSDVSLEDPRDA